MVSTRSMLSGLKSMYESLFRRNSRSRPFSAHQTASASIASRDRTPFGLRSIR